MRLKSIATIVAYVAVLASGQLGCSNGTESKMPCSSSDTESRTRLLINDDWRFTRGDSPGNTTSLLYDQARSWILPTGNDFVKDSAKRAQRPEADLGSDVDFTAVTHDDTSWQKVDLPHD